MQTFDFIRDEKLRKGLEADYKELAVCYDNAAWKSVHVLVGSLIEALLVDFLMSSGYTPPPKQEILRFDLGQLIEASKTLGLTDKVRELSVVVKSYRNLIHPGRLIRLKETVNRDSATVAKALLNMVLEEISGLEIRRYGYTAEQILSKIEKDSTCLSILPHLLKDMRGNEVERLLLTVLPSRYFEIQGYEYLDSDDSSTLDRLAKSFRIAFDASSKETKISVTKRFVSVVKEAERREVFTFEDNFFRASDLEYLDLGAIPLVKQHLLTRLEETRTVALIEALQGIEAFLTESEVSGVVEFPSQGNSLRQACLNEICIKRFHYAFVANHEGAFGQQDSRSAGGLETALRGKESD